MTLMDPDGDSDRRLAFVDDGPGTGGLNEQRPVASFSLSRAPEIEKLAPANSDCGAIISADQPAI